MSGQVVVETQTPGPWEMVKANPGRVKARIWAPRPSDALIAEIRTSEADACLIAAAPELLAALKEAAKEIEETSDAMGLNCWDTVGPQIEAAIAKAEGRAP